MQAALLVVTATALLCPAFGSSGASAVNATAFTCRSDSRSHDVQAEFGVWHSLNVRVDSLSFSGQCTVKVAWAAAAAASFRQQEQQPVLRRLLLVKVVQLLLPSRSPRDAFYATMYKPFRRTKNYCTGSKCSPTFLWTNESVQLYLYAENPSGEQISYDAAFVVAEAINVCGFASGTGELLVEDRGRSSQYAFASNPEHRPLPPNDVQCTPDVEYSLLVRSAAASACVSVTVHACPADDSCANLTIDGRSCRDFRLLKTSQLRSNVTLRYVLHRCDSDDSKFVGFVVSANVGASPDRPPSTSTTDRLSPDGTKVTGTTTAGFRRASSSMLVPVSSGSASGRRSSAFERSVTAFTVASSSASYPTIMHGLDNGDAADSSSATIISASVVAVAIGALAVGVTIALLIRRHRQRSSLRRLSSNEAHHSHSAPSTADEEVAMIDNNLYGTAFASRAKVNF